MKRLSKMAKSLRQLLVGIMAVVPLLMVTPQVSAADQDVDFSQAELDQMLAPIALYPDTILSQVLIAATYPLEVIQADRWVRSNKDLKTEDALKFAENKDWDPSVKALVAFPDILKRMSDDIDWTQKVGDAFLDDENEVMNTVQKLRKRAYASGNLDKAQHIRVEEEDSNIIIEPAEERVVYVPVYDTRVVYGNWWWPEYPPVYWSYPSSYTYVSGFYWGPSIFIGANYYYSSCQWRDRRVVVVDRHSYHSAPHFYSGRSIVRYEGAREWHHDPVHRHGVAYFSESQRTNYGSHHNSYQNDRDYRERLQNHNDDHNGNRNDDHRWDGNRADHRDANEHHDSNDHHDNNEHRDNNWRNNNEHNNDQPRIVRGYKRDTFSAPNSQTTNVNTNLTPPADRAEQLRERMNHSNDENGRHWDGNSQHIRSVNEPVQVNAPGNINGHDFGAEARRRGARQPDNQPTQNTEINRAAEQPQRGFAIPHAEPRVPSPQPQQDRDQGHTDFTPPQVENRHETRSESHSNTPTERIMRGHKRDKDND